MKECLPGVPFLLVALFLNFEALMAVFGKVVVRVEGDDATIFTGIGGIGRRRRFSWRDVKVIRMGEQAVSKGGARECIQITAKTNYQFAADLSPSRRSFMLSELRKKWRECM